MNRDEILEMPAGREMDALVAEMVMGQTECARHYSTDIAAAWQVWEKMKYGRFFEFCHELARIIGNGAPEAYVDFLYGINAETICRAALLATVEGE